MVWAVDRDKLRQVAGSKDEKLWRIAEHFGTFLDNGAVYSWSSPDFGPVDHPTADIVERVRGWFPRRGGEGRGAGQLLPLTALVHLPD